MAHQPFMGQQPFTGDEQARRDQPPLWDQPPAWEHDLDAIVRASFIVAPPLDVQHTILAAVLQAAEAPRTELIPAASTLIPVPAATISRPISLAAYLLLAAVLVAYAAALSWFQSLVNGADWLPTLAAQVLAASETILGPLPVNEPLALTWLILERAPWLALLPLAWLLWEHDRASSPQAA